MITRSWLSTTKWFLVAWTFVYLSLDYVSLTLQQASTVRQLQHLQALDADQRRVLANIEFKHASAKRRNLEDNASRKRLSAMMAWAQTPGELVVRSGERYVCQVVRVSISHIRLLLFVPHVNRKIQSDHKIKFAFREAWGADRSKKSRQFELDDPTTWENAISLGGVKPGLNQIDVILNDQQNESRLDVFVNQHVHPNRTQPRPIKTSPGKTDSVHSYHLKPFHCVGCSYGQRFQYAFPNQMQPAKRAQSVYGSVAMKYSVSLNELVCRTFNVESKADGTLMGDVTVRCWLESDSVVCIPANQVAATFPEPAKYLFGSNSPTFEDVRKLLETCDDWGRLELKE